MDDDATTYHNPDTFTAPPAAPTHKEPTTMSSTHARYPRYRFLTPKEAFDRMALDEQAALLDWIGGLPQKTRTNMFDLRHAFMAAAATHVGINEMRGALDAAGRKAIWGTRGWQEPDYLA